MEVAHPLHHGVFPCFHPRDNRIEATWVRLLRALLQTMYCRSGRLNGKSSIASLPPAAMAEKARFGTKRPLGINNETSCSLEMPTALASRILTMFLWSISAANNRDRNRAGAPFERRRARRDAA